MEAKEFGERLRKLRKEASLSQSQLADKVGVSFTYLSKIESGAKPPPVEKVILRLAEVLDADSDELIALAGKVPSDIIEMLQSEYELTTPLRTFIETDGDDWLEEYKERPKMKQPRGLGEFL